MSLSSAQLDAFAAVSKTGSFSKAAKALFITQSALSQRIAALEEELGTSLLIREPSGVRVTAAGEELLRYCISRTALEGECLAKIQDQSQGKAKHGGLSGIIRVAGYSTVMRSLVLPALENLLKRNPDIRLELMTRETRELAGLLRSGEVDAVILDSQIEKEGIEAKLLGEEEYVLVESRAERVIAERFIDHDAEDEMTVRFFKAQGKEAQKMLKSGERLYLDEIYAIFDGVAMGLGRAVAPRHLAGLEKKRVRLVKGLKPLKMPVYLSYYRQPFYTSLQKSCLEALGREIPNRILTRD